MSIKHTAIISINYTTAGFFLPKLFSRMFNSARQWRRCRSIETTVIFICIFQSSKLFWWSR